MGGLTRKRKWVGQINGDSDRYIVPRDDETEFMGERCNICTEMSCCWTTQSRWNGARESCIKACVRGAAAAAATVALPLTIIDTDSAICCGALLAEVSWSIGPNAVLMRINFWRAIITRGAVQRASDDEERRSSRSSDGRQHRQRFVLVGGVPLDWNWPHTRVRSGVWFMSHAEA